ncbi:MAG: Smr/MutS family protein [Deltaproteobacteria bacterium]|nr:Smr/MutS family protein [Deltaproteobacteria bacterium]MBW2445482.1 Smr/MutS family protein [Deltaproteobacteria bacterium]
MSNAGDDDGPTDFRRALKDVNPMDRRPLRPEPAPNIAPRRQGAGHADDPPASFEIERWGEQVEGRAPGIDTRVLTKLRGADPPPERTIDLHGMVAAAASQTLRREFARALEAGLRCVLVIHGRGLHSEGEAVLKEAFPGWLAEPPHGRHVAAFTTAAPRDGGPGACYVLLGRKR